MHRLLLRVWPNLHPPKKQKIVVKPPTPSEQKLKAALKSSSQSHAAKLAHTVGIYPS